MKRPLIMLGLGLATLFAANRSAPAQQGWEPVVAAAGPAASASGKQKPAGAPVKAQIGALEEAPAPAPIVSSQPAAPTLKTQTARQYCINIANAAADAKFAFQKKLLSDLEQELDKRIAALETKIEEYQKWVTRRDEFIKKARENLVTIYARMRPDAAAQQLLAMDEETAAAIVLNLDPRVAGPILNEMDPAKAARLAGTISRAAKFAPGPEPQPPNQDKKS
jgi:flagellar motility protein MotE (MotC chaperone)